MSRRRTLRRQASCRGRSACLSIFITTSSRTRMARMTPQFWLNLQAYYDLTRAQATIAPGRVAPAKAFGGLLRRKPWHLSTMPLASAPKPGFTAAQYAAARLAASAVCKRQRPRPNHRRAPMRKRHDPSEPGPHGRYVEDWSLSEPGSFWVVLTQSWLAGTRS